MRIFLCSKHITRTFGCQLTPPPWLADPTPHVMDGWGRTCFFPEEVLLYVVNHPPRNNYEKDTVEKFRYDVNHNKLHHLKTYTSPDFRL